MRKKNTKKLFLLTFRWVMPPSSEKRWYWCCYIVDENNTILSTNLIINTISSTLCLHLHPPPPNPFRKSPQPLPLHLHNTLPKKVQLASSNSPRGQPLRPRAHPFVPRFFRLPKTPGRTLRASPPAGPNNFHNSRLESFAARGVQARDRPLFRSL